MAWQGSTIITTALRSWADAFRALSAMPLLTAIGLACLVLAAAADALAYRLMASAIGLPNFETMVIRMGLVSVALGVVRALLLAPLAIAVHRHVLLRQVTRGYPVGLSNARYWRFARFAALIGLLWTLPGVTVLMLILLGEQLPLTDQQIALIQFLVFLVVLVVVVRRILVFPAIAVDAADAGWRRSRLLGKGHVWRVLLTLVAALLPSLVATVPLYFLNRWLTAAGPVGDAVAHGVTASWQIVSLCVVAAAASHLYRMLDPLLGQPVRPLPTVPAAAGVTR